MTDKATHTPLPWERQTLETEYDPGVYIVGSNLGGLVGAALPWPTEIESGDYSRVEANAALIVQAVNSHHRLVEALEAMISATGEHDWNCSIGALYNCTCDLHGAKERARAALKEACHG